MDISDKQKKQKATHDESIELNESRYESLRSLGRLVECDMELELNRSRRISLPVIQSYSGVANGISNSSSVADYLRELATVRNKVIHGLLPDIKRAKKVTTKSNNSNSNGGGNSIGSNEMEAVGNRTFNGNDTLLQKVEPRNGHEPTGSKSIRLPVTVDEDDTGDDDGTETDIEDSIVALRERITTFEKQKSKRMSINEDDFQSFLGLRYLEMHQKKTMETTKNKSDKCIDTIWPITSRYTHSDTEKYHSKHELIHDENKTPLDRGYNLNAKLNSLARSHRTNQKRRYSFSLNSLNRLPPVRGRYAAGLFDELEKIETGSKDRANYRYGYQEYSPDIPIYTMPQFLKRGIPHHTAKRARARYSSTGRLQKLMKELRKFSSTVQKVEKEVFISKLEDECSDA